MSADVARIPLPEKPFVGLRFQDWEGYVFHVDSIQDDSLLLTRRRGEECQAVVGYVSNWMHLRAMGPALVYALSVSLPNGSDGLPCRGKFCAGQVHPYVEPNQPDGLSYLCPSCR